MQQLWLHDMVRQTAYVYHQSLMHLQGSHAIQVTSEPPEHLDYP